jgi:hypothetical protein
MVFVPALPRPHDGVIRVAETAVDGARDRVEEAVSHTALLTSGRVAALVAAFIRHGRFGTDIGASEATTPVPRVPPEHRKGRSG